MLIKIKFDLKQVLTCVFQLEFCKSTKNSILPKMQLRPSCTHMTACSLGVKHFYPSN